ncbi:hypothetical protein [Piscinibacter gummiphilus]|nr:hypothetical protein [Piscinibacter gummiphilus]
MASSGTSASNFILRFATIRDLVHGSAAVRRRWAVSRAIDLWQAMR